MLPSVNPIIVATATKTAVQAPWDDMALKQVDRPMNDALAVMVQSTNVSNVTFI